MQKNDISQEIYVKRPHIVLINRDFWKEGNVIGEALLELSEKLVKDASVTVVTQSNNNLKMQLDAESRGSGVNICAIKPFGNNSSSLISRGFGAIRFASYCLLKLWWLRPGIVYVATNPPLFVPFLCMLYCRWAAASLVYHVQDIHPEITDAITKMRPWLFSTLKALDCYVLRHATEIVTINAAMRDQIIHRANPNASIHILQNPASGCDTANIRRARGFVYCGNAGRLQRIPLLIEGLRKYYLCGGKLPFVFAGGGLYGRSFVSLASEFTTVKCLGELSPDDAALVMASYDWAILPLEDSVMEFAFPSKSGSYLLAGARILSICSPGTTLANWIEDNGYGLNVNPDPDSIAKAMMRIEIEEYLPKDYLQATHLDAYRIHHFTETLAGLLTDTLSHQKS